MKIFKFGGTSVGSPEAIHKLLDIVRCSVRDNAILSLVVSAFAGETNRLRAIASYAAESDLSYKEMFSDFRQRHLAMIDVLLMPKQRGRVVADIQNRINQLENVVQALSMVRECTAKSLDFVMSFGEILSAIIVSEALRESGVQAEFLDSRQLVKTDRNFGHARIERVSTRANIKEFFQRKKCLQVITGFIGSTELGETTTLGRGSSDLTAAIFGDALNASEIEIWSDVDGVLTGDPRKVPTALSIEQLSYAEMMELAHFGAKVLYPPTLQPAIEANIPLCLRNTFNPAFQGTKILPEVTSKSHTVTGVTSISHVAVIQVEGSGMIDAAGFAMRLFGALARQNISVIFISQASSEHSICLAVTPESSKAAENEIRIEFKNELAQKKIEEVSIDPDCSIISVVGCGMSKTPGISGRLFGALGRAGVNVTAIAQGASELNISFIVKRSDEIKALNVVHDEFFLSRQHSINVFLVGVGRVGKTLAKQIEKQRSVLSSVYRTDLKIVGISNSKRNLVDERGLSPVKLNLELDSRGVSRNLSDFTDIVLSHSLPNSVFVDCTASNEPPNYYEKLLLQGVSVVTANKFGQSGCFDIYKSHKAIASRRGVNYLFEASVGAGLPIISTLRDLIKSGDEVIGIRAVLSGTLNFIFSCLHEGMLFSKAVFEAYSKGFTEPDPREDLSGRDVMRKLLILARESGIGLEERDVEVENLVPVELQKAGCVKTFMESLVALDESYIKKVSVAEKAGKRLCYIGILKSGQVKAGVQEVPVSDQMASLAGGENMVSFTTRRYSNIPLVVRGPGAGAEVTAAALFADIIRAGGLPL